jgi:hypothetical protein
MSEAEDAAEKTKASEKNLEEKQKALEEQKKKQQEAEAEAQKAKADAEQHPTPENIAAATAATKNATDETKKTAEAAKEKNEAAEAANNARLEEIQAIVAAGNEKIHNSKANVNGITVKTDGNLDQFTPKNYFRLIRNNFSIRVTGGEHKVVIGGAIGIIGGAKNEVVLSMKSSYIFTVDAKLVTGANKNNFACLKMDSIGGAKMDKVFGTKREHHVGPKVYHGPSTSTKTPIREFFVGGVKSLASKATNIFKKNQATTGKKSLKGSKILEESKSAKSDIGSWQLKAEEETNDLKTQVIKAGKIEIKSTETFRYEASGTATLEGGGAKLILGGTAEMVQGGSIKCDGSGVSANGKTLVN